MKLRIRFTKTGSMQYIGHLDLMRYFQKLFRRCGFDVAYSQGFNPHQLMSFASPLGLGVTTIADYLDVTLESFVVTNSCGDEFVGKTLDIDAWIDRINDYSNEMVKVTGIYVLDDAAKPSMSLLTACSYVITGIPAETRKDIVKFFNENDKVVYMKETKKSVKEINLKEGIYIVADKYSKYCELADEITKRDVIYEKIMSEKEDGLYILCKSGSDNNIKPEMLLETYHNTINPDKEYDKYAYDIERTDMYYGDKLCSMSMPFTS